jgi:hypothetical protein
LCIVGSTLASFASNPWVSFSTNKSRSVAGIVVGTVMAVRSSLLFLNLSSGSY